MGGISFDELDPFGGGGPWAKPIMVDSMKGISVQELKKKKKKGTIYEEIAYPVSGGDDIYEKEIKIAASGGDDDDDLFNTEDMELKIEAMMMDMFGDDEDRKEEWRKEMKQVRERHPMLSADFNIEVMMTEGKKKDIEMYGDLDAMPPRQRNKILRKIKKDEKKKFLKFLADQD